MAATCTFHTSMTALQDMCVCLSVCLRTENFNWNEENVHFKFAHVLKLLCDGSWWRTPHRVTQRRWMYVLSVRDRLCLEWDCSAGPKEKKKKGDQSGPRYGRLGLIDDMYTVRSLSHSVGTSAWSYIVRGPPCQLALNIKILNTTSLINSSVTLYSCISSLRLAPQCSTFFSSYISIILFTSTFDLLLKGELCHFVKGTLLVHLLELSSLTMHFTALPPTLADTNEITRADPADPKTFTLN